MKTLLDNVVTYISSVSSAGAYGTLSRLGFSPLPVAQTALLGDDGQWGTTPLKPGRLQLLVRDTDPRTCLAKAEGLHALFNNTWVTTCGLSAHFVADHGVNEPFLDDAGHPVISLNYRFGTVHTDL